MYDSLRKFSGESAVRMFTGTAFGKDIYMRRNRGKDRPSTGGTGAAERLGSMVELYFYGRSDTGRSEL